MLKTIWTFTRGRVFAQCSCGYKTKVFLESNRVEVDKQIEEHREKEHGVKPSTKEVSHATSK